jgi:hypothetical protein
MHFYSYVKRKEIGMYDTNDVTWSEIMI